MTPVNSRSGELRPTADAIIGTPEVDPGIVRAASRGDEVTAKGVALAAEAADELLGALKLVRTVNRLRLQLLLLLCRLLKRGLQRRQLILDLLELSHLALEQLRHLRRRHDVVVLVEEQRAVDAAELALGLGVTGRPQSSPARRPSSRWASTARIFEPLEISANSVAKPPKPVLRSGLALSQRCLVG